MPKRYQRWFVSDLVTILILTVCGCGHVEIRSSAEQNKSGDFEAESSGAGPWSVNPGEQWLAFTAGTESLARTRADEAYAQSLTESAEWYAAAANEAAAAATEAAAGPERLAETIVAQFTTDSNPPPEVRVIVIVRCKHGRDRDKLKRVHNRVEATLVRSGWIAIAADARQHVLREQRKQVSDFYDEERAVPLGRLLSATHLLFVDILPAPNFRHLPSSTRLLSARLISVETSVAVTVTEQLFTP